MGSLIPGYEYDIFISYRQKDNKHDGWVTEFVNNLKGELESTFKEEVSVYFDVNPHDGLLETHDVDASLKDKLKCLIFIPIISRTYCDPKSFAWEHEFKAFVEMASKDQYGLKVRLPNGNVASRVLPVQIHDLYHEDKAIIEKELGGALRAVEFIYKEPGVNKPLSSRDNEDKNTNNTNYGIQINKVANAIDEIIHGLRSMQRAPSNRNIQPDQKESIAEEGKVPEIKNGEFIFSKNIKRSLIIALSTILFIVGMFALYKLIGSEKQVESVSMLDKSIAVLPFLNDSPDKDNEYFCNGMMEEILNQLQKIGDLKVKARTTSEMYRNPTKDITQIGKDLKVSMIMEGSVRKIGNDIRINAQLIDAKTGDHLWSEIYDGKYTTSLFEFQSSVAKKVAASLNAVITPKEEKRLDSKPTNEMQAHDLYMRGHEMVRKFRYTRDSIHLRLALNLFNQALKIDPGYILALHGKGLTFIEAHKFDSALFSYKRMLELDPESTDAYGGIGAVFMYSNQPDSSLIYLEKSLAQPTDYFRPWSYLGIGQILFNFRNDVLKSLPYYQKAIDLGGDSWAEINENFAYPLFYLGHYSTALKYLQNALYLRSESNVVVFYTYILINQEEYKKAFHFLDSIESVTTIKKECEMVRSQIYTYLRDYPKAEEFYEKAIKSGYPGDEVYLACIYNETGRKKEALSILKKSIESDERALANQSHIKLRGKYIINRLTAAYSMIGDNKKALEYLSELEKIGLFEAPFILKTFPGFDNLRNDPEFKSIVKRIEDNKAFLRAQVKEMELLGEIDL